MKDHYSQSTQGRSKSAFTLVELLISMSITSIILLVMLALTATVADAWKRTRGQIHSNSSARAVFDRVVTDFESAYYVQSLEQAEWFRFIADNAANLQNDEGDGSSAPTMAMFYTSPIDRDVTQPGDVIGLSYRLKKQPAIGSDANFDLWALYRAFPTQYGATANPAQVTFDNLLGTTDMYGGYWESNEAIATSPDYLLAANVLDFQIVSWIRLQDGDLQKVPSTSGISVTSEAVTIESSGGGVERLPGAKLYAVEITLTIMSDSAADRLRDGLYAGAEFEKFIQQNSWSFTRLIRMYPESELTF